MSKFLTKFAGIKQSRYEWIVNHAVIFVDEALGTLQAAQLRITELEQQLAAVDAPAA